MDGSQGRRTEGVAELRRGSRTPRAAAGGGSNASVFAGATTNGAQSAGPRVPGRGRGVGPTGAERTGARRGAPAGRADDRVHRRRPRGGDGREPHDPDLGRRDPRPPLRARRRRRRGAVDPRRRLGDRRSGQPRRDVPDARQRVGLRGVRDRLPARAGAPVPGAARGLLGRASVGGRSRRRAAADRRRRQRRRQHGGGLRAARPRPRRPRADPAGARLPGHRLRPRHALIPRARLGRRDVPDHR